jgi:hypothetical protein
MIRSTRGYSPTARQRDDGRSSDASREECSDACEVVEVTSSSDKSGLSNGQTSKAVTP